MTIDPKQLEQDIDAIPVCEEARDKIKALFTNSFGVEFASPLKLKSGQVWSSHVNDSVWVIIEEMYSSIRGLYWLKISDQSKLCYVKDRITEQQMKEAATNKNMFKLADSLEQYYQNRSSGEAKNV